MLFFTIFIVLLISSLLEVGSKGSFKKSFYLLFFIIGLLTVFRFGVGTDFFSYLWLYDITPEITDWENFISVAEREHGELGFYIVNGIFQSFGVSYEAYVFTLSLIMMALIFVFIMKNSHFKILSLFIFYCMFYFTYINSAQRQGLAVLIFVGILFPLLCQGKFIKFSIGAVVTSLFHISGLILLTTVISNKLGKMLIVLLAFFFFILNFILTMILNREFFLSITGIDVNYEVGGVSLMGLLSRTTMLIIITILMRSNSDVDNNIKKIYKMYLVGFSIYLFFVSSDLIASRLNIYFQMLDIVLVSNLLFNLETKKRILYSLAIICLIMPLFYWNQVSGQLAQGRYFNSNSILDYPYVSVFNQYRILDYRPVPFHIRNTLGWMAD